MYESSKAAGTYCIVALKYWLSKSFLQLMKVEVYVILGDESSKMKSCERVLVESSGRNVALQAYNTRRVVVASGDYGIVDVEFNGTMSCLRRVVVRVQLEHVRPWADRPRRKEGLRLIDLWPGIKLLWRQVVYIDLKVTLYGSWATEKWAGLGLLTCWVPFEP
jgi:hypothetical protein